MGQGERNPHAGAPFTAMASFVAGAELPEFLGLSATMNIYTESTSLPNWWLHGAGLCRGTTGLSANFDFTAGPFSCLDFYFGQAAGGFGYGQGALGHRRPSCRTQA